jgi:hypothetical protein
MTTADIRTLENEIERLVREHVAACKAAAEAAVVRGFSSARPGRRKASRRGASRRAKSPNRRRSPEEIAELGERFYAAVCAKPGETMRVLSADQRLPASSTMTRKPFCASRRAATLPPKPEPMTA